jgi:hypothetical protein
MWVSRVQGMPCALWLARRRIQTQVWPLASKETRASNAGHVTPVVHLGDDQVTAACCGGSITLGATDAPFRWLFEAQNANMNVLHAVLIHMIAADRVV